MQGQSKQCVVCSGTFGKDPRYTWAKWAEQQTCSRRCANTLRARHSEGAGSNFQGGADHGWKIRRAWAKSPNGKKAARRKQRNEKVKTARESQRNLRLQLELWPRLCVDCAVPVSKGVRYCDLCALDRKRGQRRHWNEENPDYDRLYQRARKVLHREAIGSCSPAQAQARFDYYGGCCAYCRTSLGVSGDGCRRTWHWDHVIPLSRGGTNWPANIRPACAACNRRKGAKAWQAWVREARIAV